MYQELDIDISALVGPGRPKRELTYGELRPLTINDLLQDIPQDRDKGVVRKLSERHHALARVIATGVTKEEAAIVAGYAYDRVATLEGDPAFQELVAFYKSKIETAFEETAVRLAGFARDVLTELQDRLEDKPNEFTNRELKELAQLAFDRTGLGPKQTVEQNVTVNLADKINLARQRALDVRLAAARNITPENEDG